MHDNFKWRVCYITTTFKHYLHSWFRKIISSQFHTQAHMHTHTYLNINIHKDPIHEHTIDPNNASGRSRTSRSSHCFSSAFPNHVTSFAAVTARNSSLSTETCLATVYPNTLELSPPPPSPSTPGWHIINGLKFEPEDLLEKQTRPENSFKDKLLQIAFINFTLTLRAVCRIKEDVN